MPTYTYLCSACRKLTDQRRPVEHRDAMDSCECDCGVLRRVFTPTANVFVAEHFRHLQSDFLPPKGDPAWAHLGRNDQLHDPREEGPSLKEHLSREFLGGG